MKRHGQSFFEDPRQTRPVRRERVQASRRGDYENAVVADEEKVQELLVVLSFQSYD